MPELTTMLTDYALAAVTAVLGAILIVRGAAAPPVRLWGWAFVGLAAAGVFGGTFHGLRGTIEPVPLAWLWRLNEWSIGLFGLGAIAATAFAAFAGRVRRVLVALAAVGFLVFVAWTANHDAFRYVLTLDVVAIVWRRPGAARLLAIRAGRLVLAREVRSEPEVYAFSQDAFGPPPPGPAVSEAALREVDVVSGYLTRHAESRWIVRMNQASPNARTVWTVMTART
jgi:hypothetical protein